MLPTTLSQPENTSDLTDTHRGHNDTKLDTGPRSNKPDGPMNLRNSDKSLREVLKSINWKPPLRTQLVVQEEQTTDRNGSVKDSESSIKRISPHPPRDVSSGSSCCSSSCSSVRSLYEFWEENHRTFRIVVELDGRIIRRNLVETRALPGGELVEVDSYPKDDNDQTVPSTGAALSKYQRYERLVPELDTNTKKASHNNSPATNWKRNGQLYTDGSGIQTLGKTSITAHYSQHVTHSGQVDTSSTDSGHRSNHRYAGSAAPIATRHHALEEEEENPIYNVNDQHGTRYSITTVSEDDLLQEDTGYDEDGLLLDHSVEYIVNHDRDSFALITYLARNVARSVLLKYRGLVRYACVYGVLMREVYGAREWVRHMMDRADHLHTLRRQFVTITSNQRSSTTTTTTTSRLQRTRHQQQQQCEERATKALVSGHSAGTGAQCRRSEESYLRKLKDLLDEVIEQKSAIESLIRETWSFLDHEPDTLLFFDIADVESTWQRLQHKLRRLGEYQPAWTSPKTPTNTAHRTPDDDHLDDDNDDHFAPTKLPPTTPRREQKSVTKFKVKAKKRENSLDCNSSNAVRSHQSGQKLIHLEATDNEKSNSFPNERHTLSVSPLFGSSSCLNDVEESTALSPHRTRRIISSDHTNLDFYRQKNLLHRSASVDDDDISPPIVHSLSTVPEHFDEADQDFFDSELVSPNSVGFYDKATHLFTEDQRTLFNLKEGLSLLEEDRSLSDFLSFHSHSSQASESRLHDSDHHERATTEHRNTFDVYHYSSGSDVLSYENLDRDLYSGSDADSTRTLTSDSAAESLPDCSDPEFGLVLDDADSYNSDDTGSRRRSCIAYSHGSSFHFRLSADQFAAFRLPHQRHLSASDGNLLLLTRLNKAASFPSSLCKVSKSQAKMEVDESTTSSESSSMASYVNGSTSGSKANNNGSGQSGRISPQSAASSGRSSPLGVRSACALGADYADSPVLQKRRRMNDDLPTIDTDSLLSVSSVSGGSSPRDSPNSLHLMLNPGFQYPAPQQLPFNGSTTSFSFDDTLDDLSDSQLSGQETPSSSGMMTPMEIPLNPTSSSSHRSNKQGERSDGGATRQHHKYRKDELWAAIRSDYHYLMDGEIIETCKSTESDLSWESDDLLAQTKVSFTEFMQQYKELTEWLNHIQMMTQRQSASLSEKYLNQTYHEEMLQRSPRRKVFNDYAKQLMRRYPSMKDEIHIRLQHLNGQWHSLEKVISAGGATQDEQTMLRDLEQDLNGLRTWLHDVESRLLPLCIRPHWNKTELEAKLKEHQVLQRDIESHSKIVSAVLKLCEHLQSDKNACSNEVEKDSLQLVAINLERRWHAIWLQSLEWQCRLEEAITRGNGLHPTRLTDDDEWGGASTRFGFSKTTTVDITHANGHDGDDGLSDQSSCDDELGLLIDDYSDADVNSDIIPFSENEYEKITVDTDSQTDGGDGGQLSPGSSKGSTHSSACSSGMDPAIDSALGRSVSDHSINNDIRTHLQQQQQQHAAAAHSALRITSDQVNRAVNKVVSFAQEPDMRGYDTSARSARDKTRKMKTKGDHDIGYSSESHSNDEPDFGCKPLRGDQEVPGSGDTSLLEVPREGSPVERPRSLDTIVLRRKSPTEAGSSEENTGVDSGTMPSPVTPDKSWRHSMTSAYETSSQCSAGSRSNSPFDINATLDTTADVSACTAIELENESYSSSIQDLMSTSSQSFYVMTSVESDAETSLKPTSDVFDVTTGDDPAREGEEEYEDLPRTAVQSPNVLNESADNHQLSMSALEQSTPVKGVEDLPTCTTASPVGSSTQFRCTPVKGHGDLAPSSVVDPGDNNVRSVRSDSLIPQVDSEASARDAALSSDDVEPPYVEEIKPAVPPAQTRNSISKLVLQAELLVRDGDLAPTSGKVHRRRRKGRKHKLSSAATLVAPVDSYTDTSVQHTDSPVSSCDASCESESDGETSGGVTSGADQRYVNKAGPAAALSAKFHTLPRAKCEKRHDQQHTTCSVTQLYELSNRLDLAPFSISESAIDYPNSPTGRKGAVAARMRTTPYRKRKLLPRSASYECGQTLSSSLLADASCRGFCSMPGSRGQSSQEWVQQAALTSPEPSPSTDTGLHKWPSTRGADDRHTLQSTTWITSDGQSDIDMTEANSKPAVADSDNDPTWRSVFNTTGEFSENAWDPYQDPPYHVTSDDPTEEKLDPLGFENDLEYDQYFHLDSSFGAGGRTVRTDPPTRTPREKRVSVTTSYRDLAQEDSDSDLEELQHVVEESRKQIEVAETVLDNHHKDGLGTGLYLDPSPYTELVATCQTNIRCLEVLCDTIDSGDLANSTITDDDLQVIQDVIERWSELHELAVVRQQQSRELAGMAREMAGLKAAVNDTAEFVEQLYGFDDVAELETAVKDLQARTMELSLRRSSIDSVRESACQFSTANPTINMSGFATEIQHLGSDLTRVQERCAHQGSTLKSALMAWYDFRETTKELSYLVGRDRHNLKCLSVTHDVIAVCLADAVDTVHDLKIMKCEFELYENKLWSLRTLSADILPVCDEASAAHIRSVVSTMDADVSAISQACDDLISALQDKVEKQGGNVLLHPDTSITTEAEMTEVSATQKRRAVNPLRRRPVEVERPSLLWRIFRIAMPIHLTVVVLLGLAYLLDPESFSIFISPQLRYVRGPPPV